MKKQFSIKLNDAYIVDILDPKTDHAQAVLKVYTTGSSPLEEEIYISLRDLAIIGGEIFTTINVVVHIEQHFARKYMSYRDYILQLAVSCDDETYAKLLDWRKKLANKIDELKSLAKDFCEE